MMAPILSQHSPLCWTPKTVLGSQIESEVQDEVGGAGMGRSRNVPTAAFDAKMALAAVKELELKTVIALASRLMQGQS